MFDALLSHWPEYLIEAGLLGTFMISACLAVFVLEHPGSPLPRRIRSPFRRRIIIGVLMGVTAVALIYSPLGQRSGAHMNPGTTLAFLALGKVQPWDASFYVLAQFTGGLAGVLVSAAVLGRAIRHETVNHVVTVPGASGTAPAWVAEFVISLGMMAMVLLSTNHAQTAPYTGLFAGMLLALYIAIEAPLSGMSINPARTLGSAIPARCFRGLWIYFTAPPLGMLASAGAYVLVEGAGHVYCAKLEHPDHGTCIFNCGIDDMPGRAPPPDQTVGIRDGARGQGSAVATDSDWGPRADGADPRREPADRQR